jgi:hypothetical protein
MADQPQAVLEYNSRCHDDAGCRAGWESIRCPERLRCPIGPQAKGEVLKLPFYHCAGCGHV